MVFVSLYSYKFWTQKTYQKIFYLHVHTTLIILMIFFPYFFLIFSLFFSSFSFISSQPPLSSHFLLHLHSEFLSFPPLPICVSPSTINPAHLPSSDLALPSTYLRSSPSADLASIQPFRWPSSNPALPPTQLTNLRSPLRWPSSPIFLHSSPAQLPYPNVFLHLPPTLTLANPSHGFRRVQYGFQV